MTVRGYDGGIKHGLTFANPFALAMREALSQSGQGL